MSDEPTTTVSEDGAVRVIRIPEADTGYTERERMQLVQDINSAPSPKELLEQKHGKGNVWDTRELQEHFTVNSFAAPFASVTRKSDGVRGLVQFQHHPRLYYDFQPR
jgi:hypothetical protein